MLWKRQGWAILALEILDLRSPLSGRRLCENTAGLLEGRFRWGRTVPGRTTTQPHRP